MPDYTWESGVDTGEAVGSLHAVSAPSAAHATSVVQAPSVVPESLIASASFAASAPFAYRIVLQLLKPKGIKGELVASMEGVSGELDASLLASLLGLPVSIVPPLLRGVRQTTIVAVSAHARGAIVGLQGVEDAAASHQLAGHYLLAATSDLSAELLAALDASAETDDSFVGMTITDTELGLVGTITDERQGSAQTLWVVEAAFGEVLIPAVDELIVAVRDDDILMQLPQGLLEINR